MVQRLSSASVGQTAQVLGGLEPINRDLRTGGLRALVLLGCIAAVNVVVVSQYLSRLEPPSRWAWLAASMVLGTMLIAGTWGALRTMRTRCTEDGLVVEGLSEPMFIRWADVVRLRRESRRIVLERIGAPAAVISLWYVSRPDELHAAIRSLVPSRALQRADTY